MPRSLDAEATAIAALTWVASDPEMISRFIAITGIEPHQIRQSVNEPGFLAGVLDFVMAHEPSLMAFCAHQDIDPHSVAKAREKLSGPMPGPGDFV